MFLKANPFITDSLHCKVELWVLKDARVHQAGKSHEDPGFLELEPNFVLNGPDISASAAQI